MRRAHIDRVITFNEWRNRHTQDIDLAPGYFRKGRRARGCPRFCIHCRTLKLLPTPQQLRAEVTWNEWRAEMATDGA